MKIKGTQKMIKLIFHSMVTFEEVVIGLMEKFMWLELEII